MFEVLHSPPLSSISWSKQGRGYTSTRSRTRKPPFRTTVCTAKVYIAATHLEGMERVEALLKGLGRGVQDVVALHTMTIVEEALEEDPSLKV